jgi:hypothetical protein
MMPLWDPHLILRQPTAMIALPKSGECGAGRSAPLRSHRGARCGCCPRCRAFVRIEPRRPGEMVPCPSSGRPIGFVKPLDDALPPLGWRPSTQSS